MRTKFGWKLPGIYAIIDKSIDCPKKGVMIS